MALGFALPVLVLADMSLERGDALFGGMFLELASNSFGLAALAALVTAAVGAASSATACGCARRR